MLREFLRLLLVRVGLANVDTPAAPLQRSIYGGVTEAGTPNAVAGAPAGAETIINLWDYLAFKENTQAFHIMAVLGFEEWIPMDELRRRITALFGIEYENDRSLYPYIKTLVDAGLLETLRTERKQKWRKRGLFFKALKKKKPGETEPVLAAEARQSSFA